MLVTKNLSKSIIDVAREFEQDVLYTIPVDTGRLQSSTAIVIDDEGFEYHAEDYIYYLRGYNSINRTDGRNLSGDVVSLIAGRQDEELPIIYSDMINIDGIIEGFKKDIEEWLEQK